MAQCAFEYSVFKVSAVHTTYRSWLRSSSIYEPSDPPIRLEFISLSALFCASKKIKKKRSSLAAPCTKSSLSLKPRAKSGTGPTVSSHHSHGRSTQAAQRAGSTPTTQCGTWSPSYHAVCSWSHHLHPRVHNNCSTIRRRQRQPLGAPRAHRSQCTGQLPGRRSPDVADQHLDFSPPSRQAGGP
jgi:hypothetical protein